MARSILGGGCGLVSGPSVLATSEADVRTALDWMPGRILVLAEAALEPSSLQLVVPSAHLATLRGVVLLGDDVVDTRPLVGVASRLPVVSVDRPSDQRFVRRALRLVIEVSADPAGDVDLRGDSPTASGVAVDDSGAHHH